MDQEQQKRRIANAAPQANETAQGMARVFLHTRPPGGYDWRNEYRDFARIPVAGEYVAWESESPWYRVELVVHTPFPCSCEAEVYAIEVDHNTVMKTILADTQPN